MTDEFPRATEHAEKELQRHNPAEDWWTITFMSHPCLHMVFEAISHDAGFGAGHASYSIPPEYSPDDLHKFEDQLASMSPAVREEFAIGGDDDPTRAGYPELDKFLNHFFDDWELDD